MAICRVTNQAEADQAVTDGVDFDIVSPRGVWIELTTTGSATVTASGSATVRAFGSATVTASGSATVRAFDSATVTASGSATVTAGTHVAVHLHSKRVTLEGGVVIDVTDLDLTDPGTWAAHKGADVTDGKAIVYKAVDQNLVAGQQYRPTTYTIGETVEATDWKSTAVCGNGLHFSPHPHLAEGYFNGTGQPRFLACEIDLTETVVLDDKVKARACRVLYEVDVHARTIASAVAS